MFTNKSTGSTMSGDRGRSGRPARVVAAGVALFMAATLSACSGPAEGQVAERYTIRIADSYPSTHFLSTEVTVAWQEEVTELTDGRVEFEHYPAEQLVGVEEMFSAMTMGLVDMTLFVPTVAARAELPLTGVTALPGVPLPDRNSQSTRAYHDLVTGTLREAEWDRHDVRPPMGVTAGDYQLINGGGPVRGTSDWSGRIIRGTGGMLDMMISEAGASATSLGTTEVYEALQRRTIDSAIAAAESVSQYGWEEVAGSITSNANMGTGAVVLAITDEKWNSLSPEIQAAMDQATDNVLDTYSDYTDDLKKSSFEELLDEVEVYELTEANFESLQPAASAAQQAWLADQGDVGVKVLDEWRELLSRK